MRGIKNLLLFFSTAAYIGVQAQAYTELSFSKKRQIDSVLAVASENHLFHGGVLVAFDGKPVYKKFSGLNSDTTRFNTASISKSLTAVAIFQLIETGKLSLDDKVSSFLNDFPYSPVELKHLLSHTSGLPSIEDYEKGYIQNHPEEEINSVLAYEHLVKNRDSLAFTPGMRWQYNNTNYLVLSMLIERISGRRYGEYMKKYVFLPAGMKRTYIREAGMPNTKRYMFPAMYMTKQKDVDSLNYRIYDTYFNLGAISGAGNIISTVEDIFYFDKALHAGKLIGKRSLEKMLSPYVLSNGKAVNLGGGRSYGFGWNVMNDPAKDRIVFHDGRIPGLRTILYTNLTKKMTIISYDNTDSRAFFLVIASIYKIIYGDPIESLWLKKPAARVYGEVLVNEGPEAAMARLTRLRADSSNFYFDARDFNTLGYDLLYKGISPLYKKFALEVFKLNILMYPENANLYDSYGEGLLENGYRKEALVMYQKSLQLNPENSQAKQKIESLLKNN
jgi:CubicO group peptidase (beta-lactamase class C family)